MVWCQSLRNQRRDLILAGSRGDWTPLEAHYPPERSVHFLGLGRKLLEQLRCRNRFPCRHARRRLQRYQQVVGTLGVMYPHSSEV